jgi:MFS family permease
VTGAAPVRLPGARLVRGRATYTLYLVTVTWGFALYSMSSAIPQLAVGLGVSKAVAGLHGTMLSLGSVATGLVLAPITARLGRRRAIVAALIVAALGCLTLATGPDAWVTLVAAAVLAAAFTLATALANTALVVQQGPAAAGALAEACSFGSGAGCFAPLVVGASAALGWGWRPALAVAIPMALIVSVFLLRLPVAPELDSVAPPGRARPDRRDGQPRPDRRDGQHPPDRRPGQPPGVVRSRTSFAAFAALTALGTMAEMGIVFWAAQLLIDQVGASPAAAAGALTAFTAGLTAGRWLTSTIVTRLAPLSLLVAGLVTLLAGWIAVWTTTSLPVAVMALVLMGLGAGPCYPFALTLTLTHSPLSLEVSQAVLSVAGGLSGGLAPFALGWLGDRFGVHSAYTAIPWIVAAEALAAAVGWLALRRGRLRRPREARPGPALAP